MNWPVAIVVVACLAVLVYLHWHDWHVRKPYADAQEIETAPETRTPKFDTRIDPVCVKCGKPLSDDKHQIGFGDIDTTGAVVDSKCAGFFDC
jgi:hypothetical protein